MNHNILFFGDNLDILREHIQSESVDLIYLDPPFNSNANYNVLFAEKDGSKAASQIQAFSDTWTWNQESESVFAEIVMTGGKVSDCLQAFRTFLGECDMLAYLVMMAPRLLELRRVMKPTASIYLHCDPTASHYLKLLMDAVFNPVNFRNEIVWCYKRWPSKQENFQQMHDVILRYSKSKNVIWNQPYEDFTEQTKKRIKGGMKIEHIIGESGKILIRPTSEKSSGVAMCDYWNIPMIAGQAKERLGYPTQKPEALLERIIRASSKTDDVVLDPFCGCGTSVSVAERLHRRWVGIDITFLAISLIRSRLRNNFKEELAPYIVLGDPKTLNDAQALAEQNRHQFEYWATGIIDASPPIHERKKGADRGIDGRIFFFDDKTGQAKTIIVQVKSGNVGPQHIRDLIGTLTSEKAVMGVFITLNEPTKPMKDAALSAGFYEGLGDKFPKLQILTVRELLAGKKPQYKALSEATFKRAKRTVKEPARSQQSLPFT